MSKAAVRLVTLLFAWQPRSSRSPGEGEMRIERMLFFRDAKGCQRFIHNCRQRSQLRARFNSYPEDLRLTRARKKSICANVHRKHVCRNRLQSTLDVLYFFLGLLADKLQRDVQRFGPHPARIGGKSAQAIEKLRNAVADALVDVECN